MATASAALGTATVGKPANTDATAVQRYLGAIGIHVGTERLADILNLLTVFAVEFCGAAALALGRRPIVGHDKGRVNTGDGGLNASVNTPLNTPPGGVQEPVLPALNAPEARTPRRRRRLSGSSGASLVTLNAARGHVRSGRWRASSARASATSTRRCMSWRRWVR